MHQISVGCKGYMHELYIYRWRQHYISIISIYTSRYAYLIIGDKRLKDT